MKVIDRLRPVRALAAAVCIVLALGACSGDGDDSADPTVPTAASTSSTTAAPDVSVIPENIDEPYLNAVLAALDQVDGEATRIIARTKRLPPEAVDLLNAIYSDEELQAETDTWLMSIGRDPEMKGLLPLPGNRKTVVQRIIASSSSCVWMAVDRDYSAVNVDPGPVTTAYLMLLPVDRSNDPKNVNPTPWMIGKDRRYEEEPANPCPSA